jgi:hypothetical protein
MKPLPTWNISPSKKPARLSAPETPALPYIAAPNLALPVVSPLTPIDTSSPLAFPITPVAISPAELSLRNCYEII